MVGIDLYMIGNREGYLKIEERFKDLKANDRCLLIGPSGIGKTKTIEDLCERYNWECIKIDSIECQSAKELMDRLNKLHKWKDMGHFQEGSKKRVLLVDELETLIKIDRNIPSILIKFWNQETNAIPCFIVGQYEADKKISELKKMCQYHVYWQALTPTDLIEHFKATLPKNTLSVKRLKEICHSANGSIYTATLAIQQNSILDTQDTFYKIEEIFEKKHATDILLILLEDPWIYPLKVIENANKVYHLPIYMSCLKDFLYIDQWIYRSGSENPIQMLECFSEMLLKYNQTIYKKKSNPAITMDFTKLLSSISTQKKIHRTLYEKIALSVPMVEIGYYWTSILNVRK